ncbi:unnamed protein product [Staurois parvus]|uniref:Uncharacterized protein n=1 Tax=Staurois parvus TaxID=386267 RepID=A0ABN9FSN9_9NEOB|nr:unnamed protein product [Staurois parvus]
MNTPAVCGGPESGTWQSVAMETAAMWRPYRDLIPDLDLASTSWECFGIVGPWQIRAYSWLPAPSMGGPVICQHPTPPRKFYTLCV